MAFNKVQKHLFEIRSDKDYRALQQRIMPNIDPELIIGVRTPAVKAYAKELRKSGDHKAFIHHVPHKYFEENLLHVMVLNDEKDFDDLIRETETPNYNQTLEYSGIMMNPKI